MKNRPTGTQELRFLQYIAQHGPLTAGQVAETLGAELGLARSTVLTVIERLRRKRHVTRHRKEGVFVYASAASYDDVMQSVVGQFVDGALSGSVSPFVAYLSERAHMSPEEIEELKSIVRRLDAKRGRKP